MQLLKQQVGKKESLVLIDPFFDRILIRLEEPKKTAAITHMNTKADIKFGLVVAVGPGKLHMDTQKNISMGISVGDKIYIAPAAGVPVSPPPDSRFVAKGAGHLADNPEDRCDFDTGEFSPEGKDWAIPLGTTLQLQTEDSVYMKVKCE